MLAQNLTWKMLKEVHKINRQKRYSPLHTLQSESGTPKSGNTLIILNKRST
jgi:ATP/ADP translocase